MPGFKSNDLYQNRPKIKLLLQAKLQSLRALGPLPPDLQAQPSHCKFLALHLASSQD